VRVILSTERVRMAFGLDRCRLVLRFGSRHGDVRRFGRFRWKIATVGFGTTVHRGIGTTIGFWRRASGTVDLGLW
jgi:hypothetical protein